MRKIFSAIAVLAVILSSWAIPAGAESAAHGWYVRRNGHGTPGFPADAEELRAYSCYYVDEGRGEAGERRLYLTFYAGYENGNVERILDTLAAEGVPGAFFILDNLIVSNTELVLRMAEEGHLVCNHTMSHRRLGDADEQTIRRELCGLEELYREYTGREMAKYFRFPEGDYSVESVAAVSRLGYKTVFWSFGYDDWDNGRQPRREYAMKKILDNTHDGAVILLHPTSGTNADILGELIGRWREMGYTFGTLDELTA